MSEPHFGINTPAHTKEHRELLIAENYCPECGGDLDTGFECNSCKFDAMPEALKIDVDGHRDQYGKAE